MTPGALINTGWRHGSTTEQGEADMFPNVLVAMRGKAGNY